MKLIKLIMPSQGYYGTTAWLDTDRLETIK